MDQHQPVRRRRGPNLSMRGGTVTVTLIAINAAVMLVLRAAGGVQGFLYGYLALHPTGSCFITGDGYYVGISPNVCATAGAWYPGIVDGAWWMILTSAFTHLDLMHIGFNMLALYILGPPVEKALGHQRFLTVYLFSALSGSAAVYVLSDPASSTLGASGAIFGLMGTVLVLTYMYRGDMTNILIWLGMNVALTFMLGSQISWQGHLGGLVGGIFAGWILGRPAPRPVWPPDPTRKVRKQNPWVGIAVGVAVLAVIFVARTYFLMQ